MDKAELNENHLRVLVSTLRTVGRTLNVITHLIHDANRPNPPRFSTEKTEELLRKIHEARQKADFIQALFNLPSQRIIDPAWEIQADVARMWEMLEDCKSKGLKGYGAVPDELKAFLDLGIQGLSEAIENVASCARSEKKMLVKKNK